MMKRRALFLILLICSGAFFASILFAETLQISAYIPSPFGIYDRLRLVPKNGKVVELKCESDDHLGVMYYDNGKLRTLTGLYVCQKLAPDQYDWVMVSRPFKVNAKKYTQEKVVCLKKDGAFGVCINNSSADGTCACI